MRQKSQDIISKIRSEKNKPPLAVSWISESGESQLPRGKDTQAALWSGPCGKELGVSC